MRVLKLTSFKVAGLLAALVMPMLAIAAADAPAATEASSFSMLDSSDDSLMGCTRSIFGADFASAKCKFGQASSRPLCDTSGLARVGRWL